MSETDSSQSEQWLQSWCSEHGLPNISLSLRRRLQQVIDEYGRKLVEATPDHTSPDNDEPPTGRVEKQPRPAIATRLKYVFLGARARAEETVTQRQPGLVESIVEQAIRSNRYSEDLARTLFQLMVPPEFKATARDMPRLALLVDRIFKWFGLSGRAVIPMVLGFGCDTMATMVTRTLETVRERIIATVLLALAIPCSAQ